MDFKSTSESDSNYIFLSKLSNEVRSSLNIIMGYSEMIENQKDDIENILKYNQFIQASGRDIMELVNNISDLIKISKNELKNTKHLFNIETLISKLTAAQKNEAEKREITLSSKIQVSNEFLFGDEEKILRILNCILNNAIKFSKKGEEVVLRITEEASETKGSCKIKYSIEDHGTGITEAMLSAINNAFDNNKANISKECNGLGLIIARRFTDFLGGTLEISSQYGSGTTVTVVFEHRQGDIAVITEHNSPDELKITRENLAGKRVLIADDNEINREIIKEILGTANIQCETAEDGIICIAMIEQHPEDYYDLILMDLQMPNLDGVLATVLIRRLENKSRNSIPIVAISANVQTEYREQALKAGMNGFVEKPFKSEVLFKVIENCILLK